MKTCKIIDNKIYILGEEASILLTPDSATVPNYKLNGFYNVEGETLATLLAAFKKCGYKEDYRLNYFKGYSLVPDSVLKDSIIEALREDIKRLKNERDSISDDNEALNKEHDIHLKIITELKNIILNHNRFSLIRKIKFDFAAIVKKARNSKQYVNS